MKPIVDGHFHIWHRADLAWLNGPMQPRIFGPDRPIMRDYLADEYLADAASVGVAKSVYVQANWPPERFEEEAAWVESVSDRHGAPDAIVAYADFLSDDVRPQLDRLMRYPSLRGVRMQLHWHENPTFRFAASADVVRDRRLWRNLDHLAGYGLPFELQLFSGQMADGAELAAAHPDTPFIIIHGGMLEADDEQTMSSWREGMARMAAQPNCHVKLSGLGTFVHRVDEALIAFVMKELVALFGADRCLFGSNFPIEKLWTDYRSLVDAYLRAAASLSADERNAIFAETATRLYGL